MSRFDTYFPAGGRVKSTSVSLVQWFSTVGGQPPVVLRLSLVVLKESQKFYSTFCFYLGTYSGNVFAQFCPFI